MDRSNSKNEYLNIRRKKFTSWIIINSKTKTKLKNTFENNVPTDKKLSKTQISKMIQSGEFLGWLLSKIAGLLMKLTVPISKNILAL